MGSFPRQAALACIVAVLLPQVAAASVVLHVHVDHGAEHGLSAPAESMLPSSHGHAHSADTPDHDHPLTMPGSRNVPSHARGPLQIALPVGCGQSFASCAQADIRAAGDRPANQQPALLPPTVLRI